MNKSIWKFPADIDTAAHITAEKFGASAHEETLFKIYLQSLNDAYMQGLNDGRNKSNCRSEIDIDATVNASINRFGPNANAEAVLRIQLRESNKAYQQGFKAGQAESNALKDL